MRFLQSLELGAKKFHEQRTTGPLLFESAPAPPSAGFNVTFEDLTLDTAAGAPLIFARLTAVTAKGSIRPAPTQPQGDLGPCDVALGLGPEESK